MLIRVVSLTTYLHMDEKTLIDNAIHFAKVHTLMPKFYYYPTFYSYLAAIPFYLGAIIYSVIGIIPGPAYIIPLYELDPAISIIFPRILTILFATANFILLYQIGRRFFTPFTGIIACFFLLLSITHIKYSVYVKPDIAQVFFSTCVLYMCFLILEHPRWTYYVGAGIFAGFVVACKYNGISIIIAPFVAHLLTLKKEGILGTLKRCFDSKIILSLMIIPIIFFVTSPGCLLNPSAYISALQGDLSQLSGNDPAVGGIKYIQPILYLLKSDTTLVISAIAGIFYAIYKRRKKDLLLLGLILPTFLYIGGLEKKLVSHYLFFIFPAAGLLVGEMVYDIFRGLGKRRFIFIKIAVLLSIFALPFYFSVGEGMIHLRTDNRYKAAEWINRHVPGGKTIVMDALTPYVYGGYSPPIFSKSDLDYYLHSWNRPVGVKYLIDMPYYEKIDLIYSEKWVSNIDADYLITSSFCYQQFFDLAEPSPNQQNYKMFMSNKQFYRALLFNPESLGWRRKKTFDDGQGPTIIIFERF